MREIESIDGIYTVFITGLEGNGVVFLVLMNGRIIAADA
jgi:hypothetical protein